jgi:glutamine amidotransferase
VRVGVLDYGGGNLRSVLNALGSLKVQAGLVTGSADFESIDVLVFPGQGAFGDSVRILKQNQLWEPLRAWLDAGRPYLGICLGYQLLFESSEESPGVAGLGVAAGRVRRFPSLPGLKIPHMGWNAAGWAPGTERWNRGLPDPAHFYFVHSYYPEPELSAEVLCHTEYGVRFASGIARDNLLAVQFHPEKSQQAGLSLMTTALEELSRTKSSR